MNGFDIGIDNERSYLLFTLLLIKSFILQVTNKKSLQIVEEAVNEKAIVEMKEIPEQNISSSLSPAIPPDTENKADNTDVQSDVIPTTTTTTPTPTSTSTEIERNG